MAVILDLSEHIAKCLALCLWNVVAAVNFINIIKLVGMMGYGMAKATVHQLVKSVAADNSGMPKDSTTVAILP